MNTPRTRTRVRTLGTVVVTGGALIGALALGPAGCAAQRSSTRIETIATTPPPECESLGEVQGHGSSEADARKDAVRYADSMAAAPTQILFDGTNRSTGGPYTATATVFRCPPGVAPPPAS